MSEPLFSCPDSFYPNFDRKDGQQWTTHYCPGCGHGVIHKYLAEAIDELGVQDRTILVSPVGCAVFAYYYFDVGNVQVAHGRCPAAATAIKRARPDAVVLGYQGDGDLAAIGTAEIIHAANRGENLTIFFVNNAIYGMTGGQMAPTSMVGMHTSTTPEGRRPGNEGFPIRVCELLATLDAPYYLERVAVGEPKHNAKARRAVRKAIANQIANKGFSLVEILSPCPTGWKKSPIDAARFTIEEMVKTFPLGVYRDGHDLDLGHPRRRCESRREQLPAILDIAGAPEHLELPTPPAMDEARVKVAGFGGQGVLALGVILAHAAMLERRHVSWLPSYGPEMRGGTAHCSVTVSAEEIGSPLVTSPTVLVAMNGPSLEKFGGQVARGGLIVYNASMIERAPDFEGVECVGVAANQIAEGLGSAKVSNMVALGALLARRRLVSPEAIHAALGAALKIDDPALLELNRRALEAGNEAANVAALV